MTIARLCEISSVDRVGHERQRLRGEVDAAATVIAALLAENKALREQALARSAVVVPLDRPHTP
ncbi:hypothetical protein ACFVY1_46700 [Streptomyces sp. NPDC058293]|uniref:hypothetical protein n=1 Tax=Streptomyces sp. NPDC058293 TaxID=3346429 RepID=UPI0036E74C4A